MTKLHINQVKDIKAAKRTRVSAKVLADRHHVSETTVYDIWADRKWTNIKVNKK